MAGKKPAANRLHPTMKPVEFIERALMNSSKARDIVVDLFGGSGSTLIACERRGRHVRRMEIGLKYADVIIRRSQEHVGKDVALEGNGRSFQEITKSGSGRCRESRSASDEIAAIKAQIRP